ncbi:MULTISPECIES: hypothetical protein [unclassified Prochlorococcus]|uniref:hypothetical protein n=1 Tax=unclassified Prochlorococcus TaxID=2627481 RepID=UPI000AE5C0CD|nr:MULTISPECIES: hypothetical protein [unclassified Prochlorococcus]
MPFIVDISERSPLVAQAGSLVVSRFFGKSVLEIPCISNPNDVLKDLEQKEQLNHLIGDAAMLHESGISWLEALAGWKIPVILMVTPLSTGSIPGLASAYVSLCKMLSVQLIGIIQLGGNWDARQRKLDCLPWCGYLPDRLLINNLDIDKLDLEDVLFLEDITCKLKYKISSLKL